MSDVSTTRPVALEGSSMVIRMPYLWFTVSLVLGVVLVGCAAPPGSDVDVIPTSGITVVSSGVTLELMDVDEGELAPLHNTRLSGAIGQDHAVFGLALHPTRPWVFVSSMRHSNWGNARIDVFELTDGGLVHVRTTPLRDLDPDDVGCVEETDEYCAITEMAFSADGARLYVNEDAYDEILTFDVDLDTAALAFVAQGVEVYQQGLTAHPTAPYLYNGTTTIALVDGVPDAIVSLGEGGNSTTVVVLGSDTWLFTTVENRYVDMADLTDPAAPSVVDSVDLAGNGARALAVQASRDRVIAVGTGVATSLVFDDEGLTVASSLTIDPPPLASPRHFRGVTWVGDSDFAIAAWFSNELGGVGGYTLLEVADDGTITVVEDVFGDGRGRAVLYLP